MACKWWLLTTYESWDDPPSRKSSAKKRPIFHPLPHLNPHLDSKNRKLQRQAPAYRWNRRRWVGDVLDGWLAGWLAGWLVGWMVGWLVVVLVLVLFPQSWCYIDFETHLISPMAHLKSKTKVFNKLPWWWVERFFNFHPYLGKSKLNNIFQIGWNHQPVTLALLEGLFHCNLYTCKWKSCVFGCSLDVLGWFLTLWQWFFRSVKILEFARCM